MKKFLLVLGLAGVLYLLYDVTLGGGILINRIIGTFFVKTDACSLVSQEEVQAAMGEPVEKVKSGAVAKGKFCTYHTLKEPKWALVVWAFEPGDEMFSEMKPFAEETVTGIGDGAFYSNEFPPAFYVLVKKKNVCLHIEMRWEQMVLAGERELQVRRYARRVEKELAQKAVERLQN